MRFAYFAPTDTAYLELANRPSVESQPIGRGLFADFDEQGQPVGLTFEHWSAPPLPLAADRQAWAAVARQLEAAAPFA